jgi:hypothetical protein
MSGVWLSLEGDDPVEGLADLSDWLRHEPELRGLWRRCQTPWLLLWAVEGR